MTTPAGWYPDPRKPTQDRYWDGSAWTGQTRKGSGGGVVGAYRRFPRWVQIGLPILLLLIVIGAVAGSDESENESGAESESVAKESQRASDSGADAFADETAERESGDPAENASSDNTPSVGPRGTVEVDTLRWRLRDVETSDTIGDQRYGLAADANGVFVIAELTVKNNKSESVTLTPEVVSLVASDKTYEADSDAETSLIGNGSETFFFSDLGPDVSQTGTVVFDVAPPVLRQDPQLRFNELGFGDTHGYIALPPLG